MPKPVPERAVAKAAGERFYDTGKSCRNGHLSRRYTSNGFCKMCIAKNVKKWTLKRPEHPNRTAARDAGASYFVTGVLCARNHTPEKRLTSSGVCIECATILNKRWKAAHPGLEAAWARKRRAKDPTGHRAEATRWYLKNKKKAREIALRWKANNPERQKELARAGANMRRARKAANGGKFTADDIAQILEKQNGHCAVCPCDTRLEIDHVMPIILGGSSDPFNLQLLCFPCNRAKGKMHPDKWRKTLKLQQLPC